MLHLSSVVLLSLLLVPYGLRFWIAAYFVLYLLPLGPMLKYNGQRMVLFDHYIPLPYLWMVHNFPMLDRLFFPTQSIGLWAMSVGVVVPTALVRSKATLQAAADLFVTTRR